MTDATSRGYRKNFRNPNRHNVYGAFDRHRVRGDRSWKLAMRQFAILYKDRFTAPKT
jgi:hypothetical protein